MGFFFLKILSPNAVKSLDFCMMYCKQDAVTLQKDPNWADWVVDGKLYIFCKALQPLLMLC